MLYSNQVAIYFIRYADVFHGSHVDGTDLAFPISWCNLFPIGQVVREASAAIREIINLWYSVAKEIIKSRPFTYPIVAHGIS